MNSATVSGHPHDVQVVDVCEDKTAVKGSQSHGRSCCSPHRFGLPTVALSAIGLFVFLSLCSVYTAVDGATRSSRIPFRIEQDGDVWTLWEEGQLRWRGEGPIPDAFEPYGAASRGDSLALIASWWCPGNNTTGGQLHVWDLNGNGVADLGYSNWRDSTYVYEAVADDEFQKMHQFPNPMGEAATKLVCLGDGDSDGLPEMVFASGTSGIPRALFFVESREPGAYPDSVVLVLPESTISVNHMRMADLDGDSLREYIGTTQGTHDALLAIWEERGDNNYSLVFSYPNILGYAVSGEIAVWDFDGDGIDELIFPELGDTSIIHILESVGDDLYAEVCSTLVPTLNIFWVTPGPDLDRDGRGDFVVTGATGFGPTIWSFLMYESTGDNAYELVWSYNTTSSIVDGGSATGDIDGDGWPELLCQAPHRTLLFRATGDNTLELCWEHIGQVYGQGEHRIIAPDLDGDGRGEAIWWAEFNPGLLVLYERRDSVYVPEGSTTSALKYTLFQNYPNPFNPSTEISYFLPRDSWVRLDIFNLLGQKVATLVDQFQRAGHWSVPWDSRCAGGDQISNGMYSYRLKAGDFELTRKMILLK